MYCWVRRPICTDALRPRRSDEPFRHVWAALFSMSSIGLPFVLAGAALYFST